MDLEHGGGGREHSRADAKSTEADLLVPATKKLGSQASLSSSSSSSLSADLFQVDTNLATPSKAKVDEDVLLELTDGNDTGFPGPASTSQVSELGQEPSFHYTSPMEPPPVLSMERSGDNEPARIPSSVFARSQSASPIEWSVASNESLFSIHVGNNSFGREHIFMLDGDNTKSGELTRSGELIVFSSSPPARLEENASKSVDTEKTSETNAVANEPIKDDVLESPASAHQNDEKIAQPEVPSKSSSAQHSDVSATCKHSFAFPIKKKCAWTSCYCSNFSCAFCNCWNCSRLSCFSSTIWTKKEKNVSIKEQPEKPLSQKQQEVTAPEATSSNATACSWLSCACCPYKCC